MNVNRTSANMRDESSGSTAVRVSRETHARLKALAEAEGTTISGVVDRLLDQAERRAFFDKLTSQYEELRRDPEAWEAYEEEIRAWDSTLMDGLDPSERWETDDEPAQPVRRGAR